MVCSRSLTAIALSLLLLDAGRVERMDPDATAAAPRRESTGGEGHPRISRPGVGGVCVAAVAGVGPDERDTISMARALRWKEGWVGAMVIAPVALDVWRYQKPEAKWAAWASRAAKVGLVIAIVRAAN
jgi:hypothetical protein